MFWQIYDNFPLKAFLLFSHCASLTNSCQRSKHALNVPTAINVSTIHPNGNLVTKKFFMFWIQILLRVLPQFFGGQNFQQQCRLSAKLCRSNFPFCPNKRRPVQSWWETEVGKLNRCKSNVSPRKLYLRILQIFFNLNICMNLKYQ